MSHKTSSPPAKRPRVEENEELEQTKTRRSEFWLSDANVILEAGGVQFGVNRGVLSMHSPVFKDMFSLGQSEAEQNCVDGCPVVCLADDPQELEVFLEVIYCHGAISNYPIEFSDVAACIRLATKYQDETVRSWALSWLHKEFPTSLEDHIKTSSAFIVIKPHSGILIDVANLLREVNLNALLPAVFLVLPDSYEVKFGSSIVDALRGIERTDGSQAVLSTINIESLAKGRLNMLKDIRKELNKRNRIFHNCEGGQACAKTQREFLEKCLSDSWATAGPFLEVWNKSPFKSTVTRACNTCKASMKEAHEEYRKVLRDSLPKHFGLPEWRCMLAEIGEILG